jgi:hypothetical protein
MALPVATLYSLEWWDDRSVMNFKGFGIALIEFLSRNFMEGLKKTTKHLNQDNWCPLATYFNTGFLLNLFLDPEDGGDMFLRKVSLHSTDCTALNPRRWYSSKIQVIKFSNSKDFYVQRNKYHP